MNKNRNRFYVHCFSSIKTSLLTSLYLNLKNYVSCFVTNERIVQGDTVFFFFTLLDFY